MRCAGITAMVELAGVAVHAFAVVEAGRPVAAMPGSPTAGGGLSVCPEEPSAVLALSRMVAVPRSSDGNHVSKPSAADAEPD